MHMHFGVTDLLFKVHINGHLDVHLSYCMLAAYMVWFQKQLNEFCTGTELVLAKKLIHPQEHIRIYANVRVESIIYYGMFIHVKSTSAIATVANEKQSAYTAQFLLLPIYYCQIFDYIIQHLTFCFKNLVNQQ